MSGKGLEVGTQECWGALHSRLQVENQRGVLQPHGVAAHGVVDELSRGEGWLAPVQVDGGWGVGFGIEVVRRWWGWHHAITDSCLKHNRSRNYLLHCVQTLVTFRGLSPQFRYKSALTQHYLVFRSRNLVKAIKDPPNPTHALYYFCNPTCLFKN